MLVIINKAQQELSCSPGYPVLDLLRADMKLTGTKAACREGDCGACLILLGERDDEKNEVSYRAVNSCILPAGEVESRHVVTIEGLVDREISPVSSLIIDEGASQCGYCSPGIVIAMTAYLLTADVFSKQNAIASVSGNLCRCTGYSAIKRAVLGMERFFKEEDASPRIPPPGAGRIQFLVNAGILPEYFLGIKSQLKELRRVKGARNQGEASLATAYLAGKKPLFVAGGTDLFCQPWQASELEELQFLSSRAELRGVSRAKGKCLVGAGTTFSEIADSSEMQDMIPDIVKHFERIASLPIRNQATVAGNIVNGSPIADLSIYFLALDAKIHLRHNERRRSLALKDFFKGYKNLDLHDGELVESIEFPELQKQTFFNFEKVCQRSHLDIASVNSALSLYAPEGIIQDIHISAGGVAPIPFYLRKTVDYFIGKEINGEVVDRAAEIAEAEVSPISDIRGTAAYKRLLLGQLIKAHFIQLLPEKARGRQ